LYDAEVSDLQETITSGITFRVADPAAKVRPWAALPEALA
jgi:hypothetical protein